MIKNSASKGTPRGEFLKKKFDGMAAEGEQVLETFNCAFSSNILLQGHIYITARALYFYSSFNKDKLFGHGTKMRIPFAAI